MAPIELNQPPPPLSDLVPDIPEDEFQKVHRKESLQLLGDLGYLDEELFYTDEIVDTTVFKAAVKQFRSEVEDALSAGHQELIHLSRKTGYDELIEWPEYELMDEELLLLGELTALEGTLNITKDDMPETGINLFTRILHYRLKLLALYDREIDVPWNDETREAISTLTNWLEEEHKNAVLNIIGDITLLAEKLCSVHSGGESHFKEVVYFRYKRFKIEKRDNKKKDLLRKNGKRFLEQLEKTIRKSNFNEFVFQVVNGIVREYRNPIRRLEKDIRTLEIFLNNKIEQIKESDDAEEIRSLQQQISKPSGELHQKRKKLKRLQEQARSLDHPELKKRGFLKRRDYSYVQKTSEHPLNRFMIRVLQLLSWTHGLYKGRLDSEIGDLTYSSIERLVEFENNLGLPYKKSDSVDIHKVLIYIGNHYWALNIKYYFRLFVQAGKQEVTPGDSVSEVFDQLFEEKISRKPLSDDKKEKLIANRKAAQMQLKRKLGQYAQNLEENAQKRRREYHGVRKILVFFKRIGKKMKDLIGKTGAFFKRISGILKNGISIVFREIKEAFRKFYRGMKLLFGKRIIRTAGPPITTDFDFDFDSVTTFSGLPAPAEMNAHLGKCLDYAESLQFSFRLMGKVIEIARSVKLGWISLGIKIVKIIKNLIQQKMKGKLLKKDYSDLIIPLPYA